MKDIPLQSKVVLKLTDEEIQAKVVEVQIRQQARGTSYLVKLHFVEEGPLKGSLGDAFKAAKK